jgi:hypothetical protein
MLVEELRATQMKIGLIMQVVVDLPLQEMAEQIERVDVLGPILDPTAWLENAPSIQEWREVLKPMIQFQKVARDLVAKYGRRQEVSGE